MSPTLPPAYEKIQAIEFERLPERVREAHLAPPVISVAVHPSGGGFGLTSPEGLDRPAPQSLVPRLGIKSWRDTGRLGVIYEGVNMRRMIETLLQRPSTAQRLAARAWTQTDAPLRLYLAPYVDFSEISEVRFLAAPKECRRISSCLRGRSAHALASVLRQMTVFVREIAAQLPPRSHLLDVGLLADGRIRLVEVNPGLTLEDLAFLSIGRTGALLE